MAKKAGLTLVISLLDEASSGLEKITGSMKGLAVVGGAAVVAGMAAVGKAAWDAGQIYDEAMDTIVTKTGASGDALAGLEQDFKAVFSTIPTEAGPAADVIANLNQKVGMTGPVLQETSKQLLEMSRLLGGDAASNASLFGRVMGDWGVTADQAGAALDKMFVAGQQSGIGIDALMQKVVQFGAPLRNMGFTLDESVAMLAKFEKEGVNTELVLGALRIASGKFAEASGATTTTIKGGVASMAEATEKLGRLRDQLNLAQMKQGEFTDKTKATTRAMSEMRIKNLTDDIADLEAAMAKGETRTIAVAGSNKTLRDSLLETFEAIKSNKSATDALATGMEVFGARAGPDMVAAIREGRFSFDDLTKAMEGAQGAIMKTADATADFPEKFQVLKNKFTTLLMPLGNQMVEGVTAAVDAIAPAIERLGVWFASLSDESTQLGAAWARVKAVADTVWPVIQSSISTALAKAKEAIDWVSQNSERLHPIFIGLAAALTAVVVPAFVAWSVSAGAAAAATIAALAPVLAPIAAIGAAVALLVTAWDNNWLGIRDTLTAVWTGTIQPALGTLVEWLQTNIPIAIQAASDFFNIVLLPAITAIANFITLQVIPAIVQINDWLGTKIGPVIDLAAAAFNLVLLPALTLIWDIIVQKLIPIIVELNEWLGKTIIAAIAKAKQAFDELKQKLDPVLNVIKDIVSWIGDKLKPTIEGFKDFIGGISFGNPFGDLLGAIDGIIGKIGDAIGKLRELLGLTGGSGGGVGGKATGTFFAAGGLTLVGETGPELVALPRASRVYSAGETQRLTGGGDTFYFQFAAPATAYDERRVEAAVERAMARSGRRADVMQRTR